MTDMRLPAIAVALIVTLLGAITVRASAAEPFGIDNCPGVSPGAGIQDPASDFYTAGFFYKGAKGRDAATYFVTDGTLILPVASTRVWSGSSGPAVRDANGKPIGHYVYAFSQDTPSADSFGLVRLDRGVKWSPSVCHFGGPTGAYSGLSQTPVPVQYYGQGFPLDATVPARTGVAPTTTDKSEIFVVGPSEAFAGLGDEGAPVLANGQAVGIFTGAIGGGGDGAGFAVSRIGPAIARAQKFTGIKLTLLTSRAF